MVPGRAVKLGSSLSTILSLTVQPTWGTASTCARQPGSASLPSKPQGHARVGVRDDAGRFDSLAPLELDAAPGNDAGDREHPSSTTAPASRAMSQRMNETIPIPPMT